MQSSGMLRGGDLTRATRRNIQEDGIDHCHRLENLKSYKWQIISLEDCQCNCSICTSSLQGLDCKYHSPKSQGA
jgi:hypothetical protein